MMTVFIITSALFFLSILFFIIFDIKILVQISKHPFIKIASSFLVISLALIAFIFGIHSEIFSSHDKYNSDIKNSYNWFNPEHIFKFPIEQYGINKNDKYIPVTKIFEDSISPKSTDLRKITIVLDKTASIKSNKNYVKTINNVLVNYLEINNPLKNSKKDNFKGLNTEDLFLLTALDKISKSKNKTSVDLLFYAGNSNCISPYEGSQVLGNENLSSLMIDCISTLTDINNNNNSNNSNSNNKESIKTNFSFLLNKIASPAYTSKMKAVNQNSSLIILSDFVHEEITGSSFESLNYKLQSLGEKFNQVNLIKFTGNGKHPEWAKTTIELFRKNFNHLYYYEFNDILIEKPELTDRSFPSQISKMFSYSFDAKSSKPITFYHSWNLENYKYDYNGLINFHQKSPHKKFTIGYGYSRNSIENSEYSYLLKNKKNKIYAFEYSNHIIENDIDIPLSFITNKIESKNYFLEIHNIDSANMARIPIIFKPVLPITSSVSLVFLYLFFGISSTFIIIYFYWLLFYHKKGLKKTVLRFSVFLFAACYLIAIIRIGTHVLNFTYFGFNFIYLFVFIVVLLIFYLSLFNYSYLKKLKK